MSEPTETERLLQLQREAHRRDGAPTKALRRDRLKRLGALVSDNLPQIAAAISADFGNRSMVETQLLEAAGVLNAVRHARHEVGVWMLPKARGVPPTFWPGQAKVRYEPLGVIGIVSPWNYPLMLSLSPMVSAFAAGNRAILKPASNLPSFSALLKRLFEASFDEAEAAVVGIGRGVAEAFTRLPFDHIVFTGSSETGRSVMAAAAANLTPVTLELGGKSPAIVCPSADPKKTVAAIAYGKFVNAGQTCIAPDYVLAPSADAAAIADGIIAQARRGYPDLGADYSTVIDLKTFDRLAGALQEAEAAGAMVLRHGGAADRDRKLFPPAVVLNPPRDGELMTREIFGPILPVIAYDTLEEALAFVAGRPHPLALYVFAENGAEVEQVLDGSQSGGVTINGTLLHVAQDELPFGGVGESGMGHYHGVEGFRRLSHARGVFRTGPINPLSLFAPPYGKRTRTLLNYVAPMREPGS